VPPTWPQEDLGALRSHRLSLPPGEARRREAAFRERPMPGHLLPPVPPLAVPDGRHLVSLRRTRDAAPPVVACLISRAPGPPPPQEVRTFRPVTPARLAWAEWPQATECMQVARESTGVSWRPVENRLQGLGPLLVVQAQPIHAGPARKPDVKEAAWMGEGLRHGLLRGRFMPSKPQRQLRALTRHRTPWVQGRAWGIHRRQAV
jgi:hypothetical protein